MMRAATLVDADVLRWLQDGDVAIRYQVGRDLLGKDDSALQSRIAREGWGAKLLACRNRDGSWGLGFYQPKWTCTHYTLLDLKTLGLPPDNRLARESVHQVVLGEKKPDGGIGPARSTATSDVCVNGMFLGYASYFREPEAGLRSIVDFILAQCMDDGGFNCLKNTTGARHSSLHSSLSVAEGILEYARNGYAYRRNELDRAAAGAREFMLIHRLFKSDHTGAIISKGFLRLTFPPRWKYNIFRALDHFRAAGCPYDQRMSDAIAALLAKRRSDGRWPAQAAHPGQVHFVMESVGGPSRWNTLIAMRVLKAYGSA
jgi:hypothetical protein